MGEGEYVLLGFCLLFVVIQLLNWRHYLAKEEARRKRKQEKRAGRGQIVRKGKSYIQTGEFDKHGRY